MNQNLKMMMNLRMMKKRKEMREMTEKHGKNVEPPKQKEIRD